MLQAEAGHDVGESKDKAELMISVTYDVIYIQQLCHSCNVGDSVAMVAPKNQKPEANIKSRKCVSATCQLP